MKLYPIIPALAFWLLGAMGTAEAQFKEESASRESKGSRLACFIQTSIPEGFENPVMVKSGKETMMLALSNRSASEAVPIPEDGVLQFVKEIPDPEKDGGVIYEVLAQAVIPEGVDEALVILHPISNPKEGGPVFISKVQPLSDFNGGDRMYINLTRSNIGIEIADHKMGLKPGDMKIQKMDVVDSLESIPYRYSYYHAEKQKWMTLNASMTIASLSRRDVFIFSVSDHTGRIRCRGIKVPLI